MQSRSFTMLRQAAALLALSLGTSAFAQADLYPQGAVVQSLEPGPGDDLARHLSDLNKSPRSLSALLGAANAALALGDVQGALSFFARAEEVAPRDGRVKAGMASAFVASENPQAAFKFFAEAQSLGVAVADFAKDRGLAYDMLGDPVRAQADYALALRRGPDPELERRMALSRAIGGDRAGALTILDPQIRKQDRAAWRTRAFVLALTGDAAGAANVAETMMPGSQSASLRPFFEKLPQLNAADKAMAVHFGRFPSDGRSSAYAAANVPSTAYAPPAAARQAPAGPAPRVSSYGPSYRGVAEPQGSSAPSPAPAATRPAPAPARSEALAPSAGRAKSDPPAQPSAAPPPAPAPRQQAVSTPRPQPVVTQPATAAPRAEPSPTQPQLGPTRQAANMPPRAEETAPRIDFGDVVDAVQSLPSPVREAQSLPAPAREEVQAPPPRQQAAPRPRPAPMPFKPATPGTPPKLPEKAEPAAKVAEKKPEAAAKTSPAKAAAAKKAEAPKAKEPARIWVQLAAGANKNVFPSEYKKMQAKAPKLLSGKTAWTAPLGASNRLLVGPFKTDKEARDLVNELAKLKVGSYPWKSEDGDTVEKIAAK